MPSALLSTITQSFQFPPITYLHTSIVTETGGIDSVFMSNFHSVQKMHWERLSQAKWWERQELHNVLHWLTSWICIILPTFRQEDVSFGTYKEPSTSYAQEVTSQKFQFLTIFLAGCTYTCYHRLCKILTANLFSLNHILEKFQSGFRLLPCIRGSSPENHKWRLWTKDTGECDLICFRSLGSMVHAVLLDLL